MSDPDGISPSFEELIAWSMDAEPGLLPFLPSLFLDLEELGARSEEVIQILRSVELDRDSRVLDLGCGKGAVAMALTEEFGCRVDGVDGLRDFVEHARNRASERGLSDRCSFEAGDVRDAVVDREGYDLVCMLALGDVLGTADQAVAALRRCVKPGGLILIDDAFLRDGVEPPEDLVHCFDHETTLQLLRSRGDEIVAELIIDGPETEAAYMSMTAAIASRAEGLAAEHPEHASVLREYVQRQEDEVEVLCGPVVGALWLLRKS